MARPHVSVGPHEWLRKTLLRRTTWRLRRKRAAQKKPPKRPPVVEALRRARDYQRRIATAEAKDRADLARQLGFSRARMTQVLYLMELVPEIQRWVEADLGAPAGH